MKATMMSELGELQPGAAMPPATPPASPGSTTIPKPASTSTTCATTPPKPPVASLLTLSVSPPAPNPNTYVRNPYTRTDPLGLEERGEDLITVCRKQTGHPLRQRIRIGENGEVTITGKGKLCLNMSGKNKHTSEYRGRPAPGVPGNLRFDQGEGPLRNPGQAPQ